MKLKFVAEKRDVVIFAVLCFFLLFLIAIVISNVKSIIDYGTPAGINFLIAFYPSNILVTLAVWIVIIAALFGTTSSYFFDREKGFGFSDEKKTNGYSRWFKDKDIIAQRGVLEVPYSVSKIDGGGVPLVYGKDAAYVDNGESHTLVIGATGSGKTSGFVDPTMVHLMKGRESMIITDPKGEIYEHHSGKLRELGYQIIILNFREPQKGNCWNPYDLPYSYHQEGNFDKANELLNDLATNIVVDGQGDDPFWQNAAADYLTGIGLALFQDAPKEAININSVNLMINQGEERIGPKTYMQEYFNMQDPTSPIAVNMGAVVNTAQDTKAGVLTVLQQKVKTLAVTKNLSEMLSKSDFDMASIGEKPTAVFMIIQDEKTTYHSLATIFIKQCYESLITVAHKHGGALPVRTNFIVDEFANMPKFKDITTMVTAARSRHIRFTFIIQNFAQINKTYGKEEAETIRGNCGNMIYLLTGELQALEEISKLCGDKIIRVGKDKKEETRPLITVTELQTMPFGSFILIKQRCSPYKGKIRQGFDNDFGFGKGSDYFGKNVVYPQREMEAIPVFNLKEFVQAKKAENKPKLDFGPQGGGNPFMGNPFLNNTPGELPNNNPNPFAGGNMPSESELDDIIKKIDAQIAALEKEEAEEKAKQSGSNNVEKPIFNPPVEEPKPEVELKPEVEVKPEVETKEATHIEEGGPKTTEVVHSNMVDFDNFNLKENPENNNVEVKEEKEDYDDFFDDFFDEE